MPEYGNKLITLVLPEAERSGEIGGSFDYIAQAAELVPTDLLLAPSELSEDTGRDHNGEGTIAISGLARVPLNGVNHTTSRQINGAETPLESTAADLGTKDPDSPEDDEDAGLHERDLPFVRLLRLYGNHPSVIKAVEKLKNGTASSKSAESMSRYLTEMGQYDLIGYEEMQLLFKSLGQAVDLLKSLDSTSEVSADDQQVLIDGAIAHRTIYLSNLRLVVHVAKQFPARGTMTFQDMVQEGNIGLTRAIARFDVDRGNTFSTYAINWIRQSIMRGIANQARMIRIPAHRHEQFRKLLDIKAELGDNPTIEELSEAMRLKKSDILLLLSFGPDNIASLDEPLSYGDITYSHTVTHDRLTDPPESEVDQIGNRDLINKMLADPKLNLTDQEKIVLSLRYSIYIEAFEGVVIDIPHHGKLSYGDIMSRFSLAEGIILDDLGGLIGLSRERVRQIEHKAFNKIRGKYHNRDIRVTDNN